MLSTRTNPEALLDQDQTRWRIRFEIQGLPLVEGYVIRSLYGIGCDVQSVSALAEHIRTSTEHITDIELNALNRLSRIMANPD